MYNAAIWPTGDDLRGTGKSAKFKTYVEALLWLANEADSAFDAGATPEIACARVPVGFVATPQPVDRFTLYDDVRGLMLFPRAERERALDALTVATGSLTKGAH